DDARAGGADPQRRGAGRARAVPSAAAPRTAGKAGGARLVMAAPLVALALAAALQAQDPVRVAATLTPEPVPVGAAAILEVVVETDGPAPEAITIPPLPAELSIVSSSDFTQLQLAMPGGRRRTVRRQVTLVARAPGRYEIPPVTVRVRGREY